MEVLWEMKKKKTDLASHKGTIVHNTSTCIYMENDKNNAWNVHILELVPNKRSLKVYTPKLHNSFTLLTLSNLINLNMEGLPQ